MLTIVIEERDGAVIVSAAGELTILDIEEFERPFRTRMNSHLNVVALDLKNVLFLDSFGISRIVKISRGFTGTGTDFVLINLNENILKLFKIATFDRIFSIMTQQEFDAKYSPSLQQ